MAFLIKVNGDTHSVDVDGDTPLLWVLRDVLAMTGTKFGCGVALCGACTVHVDGIATRSCVTPIDSIGSSEITTIEAIGATAVGAKIQAAWLDRMQTRRELYELIGYHDYEALDDAIARSVLPDELTDGRGGP